MWQKRCTPELWHRTSVLHRQEEAGGCPVLQALSPVLPLFEDSLLYSGNTRIRTRCKESEFNLVEEMSLGRGSKEEGTIGEGSLGWARMKTTEETVGRLVFLGLGTRTGVWPSGSG